VQATHTPPRQYLRRGGVILCYIASLHPEPLSLYLFSSITPKKQLALDSLAILETMKSVGKGLSHCQYCGKSLQGLSRTGRARRNCSDPCRNKAANRTKVSPVPKVEISCELCATKFVARLGIRFCSIKCRRTNTIQKQKAKRQAIYEQKYPDGIVTVVCTWCNLPRSYQFGSSTPTAYHPKCTIEAQRARYRIKTVKRQGLVNNPSRLAADEVIRVHGQNCSICGELIDLTLKRTSSMGLTVDHWIPLSKGGSDDMTNLRPAHWICNRRKSDSLPKEVNA
jgi:5-methylcytosine-specific restriction endonuclease McrA